MKPLKETTQMFEGKEKQFSGHSQQGPATTGQVLPNKRIKQSHILLPEKLLMISRIIINLVLSIFHLKDSNYK